MKQKNGIRTFQGAVAFVTGGASGIGKAIGLELTRRGAAEIVIADVQADLAEEVAREVRRLGARGTVVSLDVRDGRAVESAVADVMARSGRIDYVFNNAGTGVMGETHLLEERDWDLTIDVNLKGVVHVIRAVYPRMIDQGFGHIVNTASVAGLMGTPFLSVYSATKHAVVALSKAMRIEGARFGVRVTALCPGAIKTPILTGGAQGRSIYEMSDERKLSWWAKFKPADVDVFAKETLELVAKNEAIIVLPKHNRVGLALFRLIPGMEEKVTAKLHASTLKHYPEMAGLRTTSPTARARTPRDTSQTPDPSAP